MADTQTPNLLLVNQTEGGNNNSWGTIADTNFEYIDDKFGDVTSISTTGGNTTLTQTQERCNVILVTGTLVSNAVLIFSGRGGAWIIRNGTSGNYTLTAKVSGQSGTEVAQGATKPVYSNGTDIAAAAGDTSAASLPTGMMSSYVGTTAPAGWVRANGRTIGNASSNATERAHADTSPLYTLLWNSMSSSVLAIFDSAGSPTTRGASAAADYAANKALALPDLRSRVFAGLDDMGNSAAGRITLTGQCTVNGGTTGAELQALTEANLPPHAHSLNSHTHSFAATSTNGSAGHTHSGTTDAGGSHSHTNSGYVGSTTSAGQTGGNFTAVSGPTGNPDTGTGGSHTHTFTTGGASNGHTHDVSGTTGAASGNTGNGGGSSAPIFMLQPTWFGTVIIRL